ncbi:hypothetical protein [Algoriphagus sp.]|uniref:hypothetical protein n=1 Tax=Algoriphagus sp. TaxID=1872435 RepID=UPI0039198597
MQSLFLFLSKWRNLLLLFCLFLLANFLLSIYMPKEHALDLKFAYSVDEAYDALNQLSSEEQGRYKNGILAIDMPYLLVYGLLFSGILLKIWKREWPVLIPVTIMVMDFFENLMVILILNQLPNQSTTLASLASIFSTGKWTTIGILAGAIIFGLVRMLFLRIFSNSITEEIKI